MWHYALTQTPVLGKTVSHGQKTQRRKRAGLRPGTTAVQWCHHRPIFLPPPFHFYALQQLLAKTNSPNSHKILAVVTDVTARVQRQQRDYFFLFTFLEGEIFPGPLPIPSRVHSWSHWQEISTHPLQNQSPPRQGGSHGWLDQGIWLSREDALWKEQKEYSISKKEEKKWITIVINYSRWK